MDFVSTVGVCAFPERMEEAASPIFGRTPDWKWGRPLRPQRKVSSPARLLELSKETGGGRTHTFWENEGGSQFLVAYSLGGGRLPCFERGTRLVA